MKSLKFYLILMFAFVVCNGYGQLAQLEAASWKKQPSQAEQVELDCIGQTVLVGRETPQTIQSLHIARAQRGHAGFYLRYDHFHQDMRVEGSGIMIVLTDAMSVSLYDKELLTINASTIKANWLMPTEAIQVAINGTQNGNTATIKSPEWHKIVNVWRPIYLVSVLTIDYSSITIGIDAETGAKYDLYNTGKFKKGGKPNTGLGSQNQLVSSTLTEVAETGPISNASCPIPNPQEAELYMMFPSSYVLPTQDISCVSVCELNGKLAPNSKIKYNNVTGINDLMASSSNGRFVFNPNNAAQKLSYAKTYAWWRIHKFIGNATNLCLLEPKGYNLMVNGGTSSTEAEYLSSGFIRFGFDDGIQPFAMDEFWIAYGLTDADYKLSPIGIDPATNESIIYAAIRAYKAQVLLGKADVSSAYNDVCNHYGGLGTNDGLKLACNQNLINLECFESGTTTKNRNIFTTLFTRMHRNPSIGEQVTTFILRDIFLYPEAMIVTNQTNVVKKLFDVTRVLYKNGTITSAQMCAVRTEINDYFPDGCVTIDEVTDLQIRDYDADTGMEPHTFAQTWVSPDIWNSYTEGGNSANPMIGVTNYMNVRIKNNGCNTVSDKQLRVYSTVSNMGMNWPNRWLGAECTNGSCGELTNTPTQGRPLVELLPGETRIYTIPWIPVDPSNFNIFDPHHTCILARVVELDQVGTYGMTKTADGLSYAETAELGDNIKRNNGISSANMTLIPKVGKVGVDSDDDIVTVIIQDPLPPTPVCPVRPYDVVCVINLPPTVALPGDPSTGVIDATNPHNYEPGTPSGPGSHPGAAGTGSGSGNTGSSDGDILCSKPIAPPHNSDPAFFTKGEVWMNIKPMGATNWGGLPLSGTGFVTDPNGWIKMTSPDFKLSNLPLIPGTKYLLGLKYKPLAGFAPSSFSLIQKDPLTGKAISGELYVVHATGVSNNRPSGEHSLAVRNIVPTSEGIYLRPNPASDLIDIQLAGKMIIQRVMISDLAGRVLIDQPLLGKSDQSRIDVSALPAGVYSVRVTDVLAQDYVIKFVKQ